MKNLFMAILISITGINAFAETWEDYNDRIRQESTQQFLNAFEKRTDIPSGYCLKTISVSGGGWSPSEHNDLWSKFNGKVFKFKYKHMEKNRKMFLLSYSDYRDENAGWGARTIKALIAVQHTSGFCAFY
ncbi:MAG: hypothetical protein ACXVCP_09355 [Bdellovibrio sp.]